MKGTPLAANGLGGRSNVVIRLLDLAQLGQAQWLFGNIYEAVVKIPERLAAEARPPSVLAPGSPVRYYAAAAPITVAATAAAVRQGWEIDEARRWLAATAGCSLTGLAVTGYLIRTVNLKVMFAPAPPDQRDALIRTWHRLNLARIGVAGGALFAANRASRVIARRGAS